MAEPTFTATVDTRRLQLKIGRLRVSVRGASEAVLDELAGEGASRWQIFASETVRSGRYFQAIRVQRSGQGFRQVGPGDLRSPEGAPYPVFLEFGTPPHPIAARRAKVLVFFWAGGPAGPGIYRLKHVQHPGTRPYRHAQRTAAFLRSIKKELMRRGVNTAIEQRVAAIGAGEGL